MGMIQKVARAMQQKFLQEDEIVHAQSSGGRFGPLIFFDLLKGLKDDSASLERSIGDGTNSDVLMSTIRWIQRAAVEAPIVALNEDGDPEPDSALQELFRRPNDFYSCSHLIAATIFDLATTGNAYWLPGQDGDGNVTELWWQPSFSIEPKWFNADPTVFIDHYLYQSGSAEEQRLDPEDVLHFRLGVDPRNTRKGLSPLRGILRELMTDDEAAAFTASLLRNGGVPSLVISPRSTDVEFPQEEIQAAVSRLETKFTGSGRGKILGLTGPVTVESFGFSPQQMDLSVLRDVAEERVTAALGIPAAVVGFGTGLQSTRVGATMRELIQMAHNNGVIPLQRIIEETVNQHLAPSFEDTDRIEFDLTQVQALREDQNSLATRMSQLVSRGIITRRMALVEMGFDGGDEGGSDDVYLLPLSTLEVPRGQTTSRPEPVEEQEPSGEQESAAAVLPFTKQDEGTLIEQSIAEDAPSANPTPRIMRFAMRLNRLRSPRSDRIESFAGQIAAAFERFGRRASEAVLDLALEQEAAASDVESETKQVDEAQIESSVMSLLPDLESELLAAFGAAWLSIAEDVSKILDSELGIVWQLSDPVQSEILHRGGTRLGLIDIEQQTREVLFDVLAEVRAEGLAGEGLARRLSAEMGDRLPAGPWRDVATRARIIARTEGAHAANESTLLSARSMDDTENVMVLDDLSGFSSEDPDHTICAQVNGKIVTIEQAEAMGLAHPNCTRSFTPINRSLMEELGG